MKINGNAIRPGNIIEYNGGLWVAVKTQHTQPGKGGAYLQVELKNIRDGRKDNVRFRSSETVEQVRMEEKTFQFLFGQDGEFNFMDHETFEQIAVNQDMVGEQSVYLVEGMPVTVSMYEGEIISITLPAKVTVTIREADAVVKGQTASGSYKPAILDNGVRVMVPPYIESGERIVVDTSDNTFVERAKD